MEGKDGRVGGVYAYIHSPHGYGRKKYNGRTTIEGGERVKRLVGDGGRG